LDTISDIYEQQRKKLRRHLDDINSQIIEKQTILAKLNDELSHVNSIVEREQKFDKIMKE
jgi:SMC interacting uncharacterized protein involved in chromosome segregation